MAGPQDNQTPGEAIAEARRAKGLSLEDLAERTKIPAAMLAALEADEYHRLSGPLYARSFLRSCAKELGLVPDDVLGLYARHAGEAPRPAPEAVGAPEVVRIRRVGLPWGRLAAGVAGAVALAVAALLLLHGRGDAPAGRGEAGGGAGTVTGVGTLAAGAAGDRAPAGDAPAAAAAAAAPAAGRDSVAAAFVPRDGVAPAGVPGLAFAGGDRWPVVVRLTAAFPVTVRARRDGESEYMSVAWADSTGPGPVPAEGIVPGRAYLAGEGLVVYWGAVDRVSLLLGSTDGVEVTVNGRPQLLRLPGPGDELRLELRAAPSALP